MTYRPLNNSSNNRKTDMVKRRWLRIQSSEGKATVSKLLESLPPTDREFCVWGHVSAGTKALQVAGVGAALLNRLGDRCTAPTNEPDIAAAVMGTFLRFGETMVNEKHPQIRFGEVISTGRHIQYRFGIVPALSDDGKDGAWLCILDWSRRTEAAANNRCAA